MFLIALLDDYQSVALRLADWSSLGPRAEVRAFSDHLDVAPGSKGPTNRMWSRLKVRMIEGDELWFFVRPPDSLGRPSDQAGYVLVRDGHPIDYVHTALN